MKIYLVRHGQSQANIDRSILLQEDFFDHQVELTEEGKQQAERARERLKKLLSEEGKSYVYFSPYLRAKQTMDIVLKDYNVEKMEHPLLIEMEFKDFKTEEEMKEKKERRKKRGIFYYRFKNAESPMDVFGRVVNFLNEVKINHQEGESVVVVAHEVILRVMAQSLLKIPIEKAGLDFENCSINCLQRKSNLKWVVSYCESECLKEYEENNE